RVADRNGGLAKGDNDQVEEKRKVLGEMLNRDKFAEVERDARGHIAWLEADLNRRVDEFLSREARLNRERERMRGSAKAVADALSSAGKGVPEDLKLIISKDSTAL